MKTNKVDSMFSDDKLSYEDSEIRVVSHGSHICGELTTGMMKTMTEEYLTHKIRDVHSYMKNATNKEIIQEMREDYIVRNIF